MTTLRKFHAEPVVKPRGLFSRLIWRFVRYNTDTFTLTTPQTTHPDSATTWEVTNDQR